MCWHSKVSTLRSTWLATAFSSGRVLYGSCWSRAYAQAVLDSSCGIQHRGFNTERVWKIGLNPPFQLNAVLQLVSRINVMLKRYLQGSGASGHQRLRLKHEARRNRNEQLSSCKIGQDQQPAETRTCGVKSVARPTISGTSADSK